MKGTSLLSTLFALSSPSNTSCVVSIVVTETFHLFKTAACRFLQMSWSQRRNDRICWACLVIPGICFLLYRCKRQLQLILFVPICSMKGRRVSAQALYPQGPGQVETPQISPKCQLSPKGHLTTMLAGRLNSDWPRFARSGQQGLKGQKVQLLTTSLHKV